MTSELPHHQCEVKDRTYIFTNALAANRYCNECVWAPHLFESVSRNGSVNCSRCGNNLTEKCLKLFTVKDKNVLKKNLACNICRLQCCIEEHRLIKNYSVVMSKFKSNKLCDQDKCFKEASYKSKNSDFKFCAKCAKVSKQADGTPFTGFDIIKRARPDRVKTRCKDCKQTIDVNSVNEIQVSIKRNLIYVFNIFTYITANTQET
jgi:hypothetical protein